MLLDPANSKMIASTMSTIAETAADLEAGTITSRALVESCLAAIADPEGEGDRAFLSVDEAGVRATADAMDTLRRHNRHPGAYTGIPIAIKDLFDVAGEVTTAGSKALADTPPAKVDAPVIARLRRAGFLFVGRTNMTEFAYSGLGINPHYDTPRNPFDRARGRVPGGSTSGGAVAVADGMATVALGTDTGGSCRIPAAFCGIVGYKPTQRRVPLAGATPLSSSLDSIGPLAASVDCCARLDRLLAAEPENPLPMRPVAGLRLAAPTNFVLDEMDETVARAFERTLDRLRGAGATVTEMTFAGFDRLGAINAGGGFAAAESYAWHRPLIEAKADLYDPRVVSRIIRGKQQSAADYIDLLAARQAMIEEAAACFGAYDAMVMPTVPIVAPALDQFGDDDTYGRLNMLALRNPSTTNFLDGCAISVPVHEAGAAPVGLMLAGAPGGDRPLFQLARGVEAAFS